MRPGHLHLCLFRPEIPQNTGNLGRLAAATQCRLHLIRPLGFSMSDKNLRRPGLDYWPYLDLEVHDNIEELLERFEGKFIFFSKFAKSRKYTEIPADIDLFIYGNETSGLPKYLHETYEDKFYHIPMFHEGVRSLNLANSVALTTYHQLAKRGVFEAV